MRGYILDTNVYNLVLDGKIDLPVLAGPLSYYATHVQMDELAATPDEDRRDGLLRRFQAIPAETLPTESLVLDVSRLGHAKVSDGALFSQIRELLDARNNRKASNTQDALIAETAINNSLTLVTGDGDLLAVTRALGGLALPPADIGRVGTTA